ncbi:ankyrin repeat-containing protein BDA1-like [Hevea brasiliensis]|uniref:ankyrin repeat-containing protein BDA1-like n=1 Tax=Hevea brasiliensis TaxID=3981 RepID=UPI0025EE5E46|nr:ankyrin repeat-containing protein BDA1-like [Hevea brasiliensis]XP_058007680.1 ankyrin repeat-containing protein BDA1-like [Hevea brasiliensis]
MNAQHMGQRLKEAAQTGDIDVLYGLTREDAFVLERVNEVPFVDSPLHIAASAGHIEFAMEMVNMKASFARKLNPDDFSPMHLALQHDKTQMVLWLLYVDEGLVRVKGRGGMTPLHYATEQGKTPILEEFFEACPESIKDVTFQGDTALHTAVKNHQVEAFQLLMGWLQRSVFVDAAFWERELLNWKNKEGNTVLHIAASSNQRQIVKHLIEAFVYTNIKNSNGLTAIDILQGQAQFSNKELNKCSAFPLADSSQVPAELGT